MIFSAKKQKGLTFIGLMLILVLFSFITLLGLKVVPLYMNHNKLVSVLEDVRNLDNVEQLSKNEITSTLTKRINMNFVDKVDINDFYLIKRSNYLSVELKYERVAKIFGNLSALVEFHESFEVGEDT
ncbi:MAG: DUF4845 domain-containing protein [Methylococcales bacterium]|nr:DUF4845 domain-containing protein [Methylococcales bacterium]